MKISVIIPAAGRGTRFDLQQFEKSPTKLFVPLQGKPVLAHTLAAFQDISRVDETIVAVSPDTEPLVRDIVRQHKLKSVKIVQGRATRAESVWNALKKVNPEILWVMVHDGARPLISRYSIEQLMGALSDHDGVILATRVIPTIKEASWNTRILRTVDRKRLYEAETPQFLRKSVLEAAYLQVQNPYDFTDEASLLEAIGADVCVCVHEKWNPKLTTLEDLKKAEAYLAFDQAGTVQYGLGRDLHRLVKGRKLMLGGILIPGPMGSLGHSDGDALLHAIADAILGAMAAGDIGEWFSDKNPEYKGKSSAYFIRKVMSEAQQKGYRIQHVDTVIHLEKPKLGPLKHKMALQVAKLLGLAANQVSIKAKTMEGLGEIGRGTAVAAEAIVTVRKVRP